MDLKQELVNNGLTGIVESASCVETDYITVEIKKDRDSSRLLVEFKDVDDDEIKAILGLLKDTFCQ